MGNQLTGRVVKIFEPKSGTSAKGTAWNSQEFLIEEASNPQYPNLVMFSGMGKVTFDIANLKIGEEVEVHFNLRTNKYTKDGKDSYFTQANAWLIKKVQYEKSPTPYTQPPAANYTDIATPTPASDEDLPF